MPNASSKTSSFYPRRVSSLDKSFRQGSWRCLSATLSSARRPRIEEKQTSGQQMPPKWARVMTSRRSRGAPPPTQKGRFSAAINAIQTKPAQARYKHFSLLSACISNGPLFSPSCLPFPFFCSLSADLLPIIRYGAVITKPR